MNSLETGLGLCGSLLYTPAPHKLWGFLPRGTHSSQLLGKSLESKLGSCRPSSHPCSGLPTDQEPSAGSWAMSCHLPQTPLGWACYAFRRWTQGSPGSQCALLSPLYVELPAGSPPYPTLCPHNFPSLAIVLLAMVIMSGKEKPRRASHRRAASSWEAGEQIRIRGQGTHPV